VFCIGLQDMVIVFVFCLVDDRQNIIKHEKKNILPLICITVKIMFGSGIEDTTIIFVSCLVDSRQNIKKNILLLIPRLSIPFRLAFHFFH